VGDFNPYDLNLYNFNLHLSLLCGTLFFQDAKFEKSNDQYNFGVVWFFFIAAKFYFFFIV